MAKRYHLNPHSGEPGECTAKISCPYGDLTSAHFDSPEDARNAYEQGRLDDTFMTLRRVTDEAIDVAFEDIGVSSFPTDEAQWELSEQTPIIPEFDVFEYDEAEGPTTYEVRVGGQGGASLFVQQFELVGTAEALVKSGQWEEFSRWDADQEKSLGVVHNYLRRADGLHEAKEIQEKNHAEILRLGQMKRGLSEDSKKFQLELSSALAQMAETILARKMGEKWTDGKPPF